MKRLLDAKVGDIAYAVEGRKVYEVVISKISVGDYDLCIISTKKDGRRYHSFDRDGYMMFMQDDCKPTRLFANREDAIAFAKKRNYEFDNEWDDEDDLWRGYGSASGQMRTNESDLY